MAQVHVCHSAAREPFRNFQDNTVRCVCVPEGEEAACQLYVAVEQPGRLSVEAEGIELFNSAVDQSTNSVPLSTILGLHQPAMPHQGSSILLGLRSRFSSHKKTTAFRVIVTKNDPQPDTVAATFNFQLLDPTEYETKYMEYLSRLGQVKANGFVVDWQLPQSTCWNCHASIDGPTCTVCGSDQE